MAKAAPTFAEMASKYRALWNGLEVKSAGPADAAAKRIMASKARYQAVQMATTVPWFFIAIIHMRESNNDFRGVLHNGQRIIGTGKLTTIVPKGRGPFATWEEAAVDALQLKQLDKITHWPIERIAYEAERYNGWGYFWHGIVSPYLWGGSSAQQRGKYVSDGKFDPNVMDVQLGAMTVLRALMDKDSTVEAAIARATPEEPVKPKTDGPMSGRFNERTKQVQTRLKLIGYHEVGKLDGKWGGKTAAAIKAFMVDRAMPGEVEISDALDAELQQAEGEGWERPIAAERREVTVDELAPKKKEIKQAQKASFWSKVVGWWSALFGGVTALGTVQSIGEARSIVNPVREWFGDNAPMVLGFGFVGAVVIVSIILAKKATDAANASADAAAQAYREGKSEED